MASTLSRLIPSNASEYESATEEGNVDDVASGPATLYEITCTLGDTVTTARWLFIFDASGVPVSGRVGLKKVPYLIPEGGMIQVEFRDKPLVLSTGLSFGISDSSATYSQAGVANFNAIYV